jgi:hypothetical protein
MATGNLNHLFTLMRGAAGPSEDMKFHRIDERQVPADRIENCIVIYAK